MLYNFDWLKPGEYFPPKTEISRMKSYIDNENLFNGETNLVLGAYLKRLQQIIFGLKETDATSPTFFDTPNYWQLISIKTADLAVGEKPDIMCTKHQAKVDEGVAYADLYSKLPEMVIDNDSLGDCIVVPYIDEYNRRTFSVNSPVLWMPVVNPENVKQVLYDCMCWTVCTKQDHKYPINNKYELRCKIQKRGETKYLSRVYEIRTHEYKTFIDEITKENCGDIHFFKIGKLLSEAEVDAPFTQAVIHFPGLTTSRNIFGISNYERVTGIVGEITIRQALANYILDENSAPKMAAPEGAFVKNKDGRWVLKSSGKNFVVKPGEQNPIYITWDGNLTSNEQRIAELKRELYAMSEMGTVISHEDLNSSQGYEALEVKMTNPKLKVRRLCTRFEKPLKQLVAYLSGVPDIQESDISINFNNGLPVTDMQNLLMAEKEKTLGVSTKKILTKYLGYTEEEAEEEIERASEESSDNAMSIFARQNGLFGGGTNTSDNNSKKEKVDPNEQKEELADDKR